MRNNQLGFCMVLALLGLSGCASTGSAPNAARVGDPVSVEATASALGSAQVGDSMVLPAGNELGASTATVIKEYNAASGRLCRRIQLDNASGSIRIVCMKSDGQWDMPRALDQRAFQQLPIENKFVAVPIDNAQQVGKTLVTVPEIETAQVPAPATSAFESVSTENSDVVKQVEAAAATDVVLIEASANNPASQLREVALGETLWKFSKRVTGNALNWSMIADYNDIDDARTVSSGMVLKIPAHLLRLDAQ